jgi:membrane fusion protein (multidrug efflux system)
MADRSLTRLIARLGSNGRGRWIVAGVLIVLVVIVAAWVRLSGRETTDDAQIDGHIAPVAARIGGSVATVLVHDNQTVQAGDVLLTIDTRDLEVALAKAQADLDEARATAKAAHAGGAVNTTVASSQLAGAKAEQLNARTGVELADSDIEAATAKLSAAEARKREAEANLAKATKDRERLEPLVKKDEVSHQQFDLAVTSEAAARASLDSAHAAVIEAQKAVDIARSRKSQAQNRVTQASSSVDAAATVPAQVHAIQANAESADARVAQEEAAVAQARLNLEYATIRAPIVGLVSRKTVEVGQIVQPGQPLMALVPLDKVWVTANFKETQLAGIRPGQEASISVDAYGGRTFKGSVDSIAAATGARFSLLPPENASGNFVKVVQRVPVKIAIDTSQDPQHVLRPGMSVEATVFTR